MRLSLGLDEFAEVMPLLDAEGLARGGVEQDADGDELGGQARPAHAAHGAEEALTTTLEAVLTGHASPINRCASA